MCNVTECKILNHITVKVGPVAQSVQRLAAGWTVWGSNPGGGPDFPHLSIPVLGPIKVPVQCVPGSYPGVKRPGRGADHPPNLAPRLKNSRATPLLPLCAFVACSRVNCTFRFYLYRTGALCRRVTASCSRAGFLVAPKWRYGQDGARCGERACGQYQLNAQNTASRNELCCGKLTAGWMIRCGEPDRAKPNVAAIPSTPANRCRISSVHTAFGHR